MATKNSKDKYAKDNAKYAEEAKKASAAGFRNTAEWRLAEAKKTSDWASRFFGGTKTGPSKEEKDKQARKYKK